MIDYIEVSIGDICSRFSSGKTIVASCVKDKGLYPVYGGNGLRGYTDTYNFDGECAIIGRQGAYCGNVRYFKGKAYMTEHAIVACAKEKYNIGYIAYLLSIMHLEQYQGQSAQPGLSVNTLSKVKVLLPKKEIQDSVFRTLQSFECKIENNKKINIELEAMARTFYDYWFLQFNFPDKNGNPYKSSGGKMVWNEELKSEIPDGWEIDEIGDLIKSERGISYSSATIGAEGVPMINLASFNTNGSYKSSGIKMYSGIYEQDKVLKPYDLLMCNTQQTAIDFKKDIIGKAILVPDIFEGDIVSSHHVTAIKPYTDEMKYYLYYLFNTEFFHKYIAGYTNGTNILGLLFEGVEKYKVAIPCKSVLKQYANIVKDIEKQKSKIIKENQELTSLRDFLLPLLMSGQVGFKEC